MKNYSFSLKIVKCTLALYALIALIALGCSQSSSENVALATGPSESSAELLPYQNIFYSMSIEQTGIDVNKNDIKISFGDLGFNLENGGRAGACYYFTKNGVPYLKYITIDKKFFDNAKETYRVLVILHEMGHCALRRPHRMDDDGIFPLSIMYPYSISDWLYESRSSTYNSELFSNSYLFNPSVEVLFSPSSINGQESDVIRVDQDSFYFQNGEPSGCNHKVSRN